MKKLDELIYKLRDYKFSHMLATAVGIGFLDALVENQEIPISLIAQKTGIQIGYAKGFARTLQHAGLVILTDSCCCKLTELGIQAQQNEVFNSFSSYHMHVFEAWSSLRTCCREGMTGGKFHRQRIEEPDFCKAYLLAMDAIAAKNVNFLKKKCLPLIHGRILDIGAGPSTFCRHLAKGNIEHVTGIDLDPIVTMAQKLFEYPENYSWESNEFETYQPEERFDCIYCSHILEYCTQTELVLWIQKIKKLLKPGGISAFVIFLRESDVFIETLGLDMFEISTGLNGAHLGHITNEQEIVKICTDNGGSLIDCSPLPGDASYSEYLITCKWN